MGCRCSCHWLSYCDVIFLWLLMSAGMKDIRLCFLFFCHQIWNALWPKFKSELNWLASPHTHAELTNVWLDFPASAGSKETGGNFDVRFFAASFRLSPFPLYAHRMTLFRCPGRPKMSPSPTSTSWEPAVPAHGPLYRSWSNGATASQISCPAHTMPVLKEGFSFRPRNQRSFWKPWITLAPCVLQGCANAPNMFMLIWGLHLCIWTLYTAVRVTYSMCCIQTGGTWLCYKIHITAVNKWKCIWIVHLTWCFYQVHCLCSRHESYFCYCTRWPDATFSSVEPENRVSSTHQKTRSDSFHDKPEGNT